MRSSKAKFWLYMALPITFLAGLIVFEYGFNILSIFDGIGDFFIAVRVLMEEISLPIADIIRSVIRPVMLIMTPLLVGLLMRSVRLSFYPMERVGAFMTGLVSAMFFLMFTRWFPQNDMPALIAISLISISGFPLLRHFRATQRHKECAIILMITLISVMFITAMIGQW